MLKCHQHIPIRFLELNSTKRREERRSLDSYISTLKACLKKVRTVVSRSNDRYYRRDFLIVPLVLQHYLVTWWIIANEVRLTRKSFNLDVISHGMCTAFWVYSADGNSFSHFQNIDYNLKNTHESTYEKHLITYYH